MRGALTASVNAAGQLSVTFEGKQVGSLRVGSYRITVTDRSATGGFALAKKGRPTRQVTGAAFVGKRSLLVTLTAGRWLVTSRPGAAAGDSFVVSS